MEYTLKYILILLIIVVFYYLLNCNNNGFSIGRDVKTFKNCNLDLISDPLPTSYEGCMKKGKDQIEKGIDSCSSTSNALLDRVCHAGYPTDDFSNASLTDNAKKNCSNCKINKNDNYSRVLKCDCNNTNYPLFLNLNGCNIDKNKVDFDGNRLNARCTFRENNKKCIIGENECRFSELMCPSTYVYDSNSNKCICSDPLLERDIDNICKEKILKDFFKDIKPENLYNNVIESYCNNDDGKKKGIFISMFALDWTTNTVYIDNSGSFLRNDLSWNLFIDGFGLLWDPKDLNKRNNFLKCAYRADAWTMNRFNTSNFKVGNRCGRFSDVGFQPSHPENLVPIECKDSDCISKMFLQMKKNGCPCEDSCNLENEVVYNTNTLNKSFKEFYENNDNIKPSGLIFFISRYIVFHHENTGEVILSWYSDDIYLMKKTFPLDTKVIILFDINPYKAPYKAPVFNGITTLEKIEKYLGKLNKLNIKQLNDKCKINRLCPV